MELLHVNEHHMTGSAVMLIGTLVMTLSDHFRTEQHEPWREIDFTTQRQTSAAPSEKKKTHICYYRGCFVTTKLMQL